MKKQYINNIKRENSPLGATQLLKRIVPRRLCAGALVLTCVLLLAGCPDTSTGTGPTGPDPITNLNIIPQANGVVLLSWEDTEDVNFSHVLISWTPDAPPVPVRIEKGTQMATIIGLADAVEYTFRITTVSTTGAQTTNDAAESTTATNTMPPPVTNLAAGAAENGRVEITWTDSAASDLSHILLSWIPVVDGQEQPLRIEAGTEAATVTGLTDGTPYMFRAVGVDEGGGTSTETAPVSVTADATPPPPVALTAAAGPNGRATVTWTDPADSDFSHILLSWTPVVSGQEEQPRRIDSGAGAAVITGLTHAQTYTFTAVSVDAAGNRSAASTGVTATADTATIGPVILTAAAGPDGSAVITWDDPPGAAFASIALSWSGAAAQTSPLTVNAGAETTTITGLTNGTEYSFTAVSVTTSGDRSAASDAVTVTADSVKPDTPSNFSATPGVDGSVVVSWLRASGSAQTVIAWSPVPAGAPQIPPLRFDSPAELLMQSTTITGLTDGTNYTIRGTSVDAAGNVSTETVARVVANAAAPAEVTNLRASATVNTATVTWTDPATTDFSHVLVTWSPEHGSPDQPLRVNAGTETATLANLESVTEYTVTLRSVDTAGNTSPGTAITAATIAPVASQITNPTATIITADGNTTLSWTDPTDTTSAVRITITGSPAPTTPIVVALGTQTAAISGLRAPGADHVFTISTQNSSGTTANSGVAITARSALTRPVALFQLGGNTTHTGDFGYAACQAALGDTNNAIAAALRAANYTEAVFFGQSTTNGSQYSLAELAASQAALGFNGSTAAQLENRKVVIYAAASPTETFGTPAVSRTIGNVIKVNRDTGAWMNGGYDVVGSLVGGTFWSFANIVSINNDTSCSGAASTTTSLPAIVGNSASVNGDSRSGETATEPCSSSYAVICAAH